MEPRRKCNRESEKKVSARGSAPGFLGRLDEFLQQGAVTMRRVLACRRAEQSEGFARRDLLSEDADALLLLFHLLDVALPLLVPADRRAVLAVEGGVQLLARAELAPPQVPGLLRLRQGPRPVAADQQ